MDLTTMPAWAQTALAYATVVIVALTMLANFLDWAVPRLRALAPSPKGTRVLTALQRFALALTALLAMVHRLVPRLTVIEPPSAPKTPPEDDDSNDGGGSAPPSASPPPDRSTMPSPAPSITPATLLPPPLSSTEPHGPYAT